MHTNRNYWPRFCWAEPAVVWDSRNSSHEELIVFTRRTVYHSCCRPLFIGFLCSIVFTRTWLRYVWVYTIANQSVSCLSVVCSVRAPYSGVEAFGNFFSPFGTLAIVWPPCKIIRRSSHGNPSVRSVNHKRGSKIHVERWWTHRRLYLTNGLQDTPSGTINS